MYPSVETEKGLQELVLSSVKNNVQETEKNIENNEQLKKVEKPHHSSVGDITEVIEESESLKLCAVWENGRSEAHKC